MIYIIVPSFARFFRARHGSRNHVCHAQRHTNETRTSGVFALSAGRVGPNRARFLLDRSFAMPKPLGPSAENVGMGAKL